MFDNIALNVVTGLVFIYLLYSLFATVVAEIIATKLGLRARNLKEAVDRMLNDEPELKNDWRNKLNRLWDSLRLMKNPENARITNFYNHPEIKYLGSTGVFKVPSSFKAVSFSKTLLYLLNETGYKKLAMSDDTKIKDPDEGDIKDVPVTPLNKEQIAAALKGIIAAHQNKNTKGKNTIVLDEETAKYVLALWYDCYGDLVKFKLQLEAWFDRTMEQATEWYKRKIQIVLLVLGFTMAWFFNADTFTIIGKLATDKDAREKIVMLAAAYSASHTAAPTSPNLSVPKEKIDSLMDVKKKLEEDIANANTILGSGGWLPDSVTVTTDPKTGSNIYAPLVDEFSLLREHKKIKSGKIGFTHANKWGYFFRLLGHHFFGFLITAIAISLGAPFWYDMLNKLMKLRTAAKQDTNSSNSSGGTSVSPLNREA